MKSSKNETQKYLYRAGDAGRASGGTPPAPQPYGQPPQPLPPPSHPAAAPAAGTVGLAAKAQHRSLTPQRPAGRGTSPVFTAGTLPTGQDPAMCQPPEQTVQPPPSFGKAAVADESRKHVYHRPQHGGRTPTVKSMAAGAGAELPAPAVKHTTVNQRIVEIDLYDRLQRPDSSAGQTSASPLAEPKRAPGNTAKLGQWLPFPQRPRPVQAETPHDQQPERRREQRLETPARKQPARQRENLPAGQPLSRAAEGQPAKRPKPARMASDTTVRGLSATADVSPRRKETRRPAEGLMPSYSTDYREAPLGTRALRGTARVLGVLGVLVASLLILAFGAITVVCKGPFPVAKELFVVSVTETSAVKFLANIYFSKEEVAKILESNTVQAPAEVTDTTKTFEEPAPTTAEEQPIEIKEVFGPTFKGRIMIVKDPSRVRLATIDTFGKDVVGKKVEDFVADSGAIAGINAGGFMDEGGVGKGGQPLGLLIHDGVILSGTADTECNVVGLTYENQLVVGNMTGAHALELGVRDAVYFEPTLIVNGTPAEFTGTGGGLNPRTAIGQRADGAILMLVIDGRQPHSMGATLHDVMQIMLDYGAVNASNLDGGSSSLMVYKGEVISVSSSLYGSRAQPAAFIVDAP